MSSHATSGLAFSVAPKRGQVDGNAFAAKLLLQTKIKEEYRNISSRAFLHSTSTRNRTCSNRESKIGIFRTTSVPKNRFSAPKIVAVFDLPPHPVCLQHKKRQEFRYVNAPSDYSTSVALVQPSPHAGQPPDCMRCLLLECRNVEYSLRLGSPAKPTCNDCMQTTCE